MKYVYDLLEKERERLLEEIKSCDSLEMKAGLIGIKNLVEYSSALLKKYEEYDVKLKSVFTKLPDQKVRTPGSEYRIIEDYESDDNKYWEEVICSCKQVRLHEGDVIIEV